MDRVKVITDITDLIPLLRAVNTQSKKKVLEALMNSWKTIEEIEKEYGAESRESILTLVKMKVVETKWKTNDVQPEKIYHTFYNSYYFNAGCNIQELSEILAIATMDDKEYEKIENNVLDCIGDKGKFIGVVSQEINLPIITLKSIVKRSNKLVYKGHRIEKSSGGEE